MYQLTFGCWLIHAPTLKCVIQFCTCAGCISSGNYYHIKQCSCRTFPSLQKDKWTSLRYTRRPYTLEILSLKPRRKVTVILEVLDMEGRSDWVETNSVAICDGIVVWMDNIRGCRCLNQWQFWRSADRSTHRTNGAETCAFRFPWGLPWCCSPHKMGSVAFLKNIFSISGTLHVRYDLILGRPGKIYRLEERQCYS